MIKSFQSHPHVFFIEILDFLPNRTNKALLGDEQAHFKGFFHEKMVVINFCDFCFENTKS